MSACSQEHFRLTGNKLVFLPSFLGGRHCPFSVAHGISLSGSVPRGTEPLTVAPQKTGAEPGPVSPVIDPNTGRTATASPEKRVTQMKRSLGLPFHLDTPDPLLKSKLLRDQGFLL